MESQFENSLKSVLNDLEEESHKAVLAIFNKYSWEEVEDQDEEIITAWELGKKITLIDQECLDFGEKIERII